MLRLGLYSRKVLQVKQSDYSADTARHSYSPEMETAPRTNAAGALLERRAESPQHKGVYAHQSPIPQPKKSPSPQPKARSPRQHSPSPQQNSLSSQQCSPSPLPTPSLHSPSPMPSLELQPPSESNSDSSPGDSLAGNRSHVPNPDQIQQLLEDFFSSSSTSSDSDENLETVLSSVLRDPLEDCMEGIEDLATGILKTGKLSLQGEPGDMSKLQPVLLGLQAMEREIAQLLPQLMQVPFFEQFDIDDGVSSWSSYGGQGLTPEDFLASGHVRLGLPVDSAIYHLLNRHCAKGAKQAEEVIQTSQTVEYVKKTPGKHLMPVLIFSASVLSSPNSPLMKFCAGKFTYSSKADVDSEVRDSDSGVETTTTDAETGHFRVGARHNGRRSFQKDASQSSLLSSGSRSEYQDSLRSASSISLPFSPYSSSTSISAPTPPTGGGEAFETIEEDPGSAKHDVVTPPPPAASKSRRRKTNTYHRPLTSRSSSEFSDDGSVGTPSRLILDRNQWNSTVMDSNMIVAMYGDTTYPLLVWNQKFKLDFEVSSSMRPLTGLVVGVDPDHPMMSIRLHNPTPFRVAFSIRAYRQTTIHNSHVVYPPHGLHVLEQHQCWEENADIHAESPEKSEYFTIELFISTLEGKPSWNVMRKYAVMKPKKNRPANSRRSSRRPTHFQMPGTVERKYDNLRLVIAHGLQCVVKNKHSAAEVIFTQALFLPDFQRIELKAFVYICLAVVAYRRKNAGEIDSLIHAMNLVNSVDKLVEACEAPSTVRMPRTVHLVKQLRKELNFSDVVKSLRKEARHKHRKLISHYRTDGASTLITEEGGLLSHHRTKLLVPRGALESQTEVTLTSPDHKQLQSMLTSTGWEKIVRIVCAVHIECSPTVTQFCQPVKISSTLPDYVQCRGPLHPLFLLHSRYLRKWDDVSLDSTSAVSITDGRVDITTSYTGWLAATVVQLDPVHIASMAMQALSVNPMTLQVCVFGQRFPDDIMQITVVMSPCKDTEDPVDSMDMGSIDHAPISFPHLLQAYPGEQLRCHLRGAFEPDASSGEVDLNFNFKATQAHSSMCGKFVHLTLPSSRCHGGKLIISRYLSGSNTWDDIAEVSVHLSRQNGHGKGPGSKQPSD